MAHLLQLNIPLTLKTNNMTAVHKLFLKWLSGDLSLEDFEEAKAMEWKQLVDAHIEGQRVFDKHDHTQWTTDQAEQYYNETYKK